MPEFSLNDPIFLAQIAKLVVIYNISWLLIILWIRGNEFYFNPNYYYFKSIFICMFFFVGFVMTLVILFKMSYFNRSSFILPIFIFSYLNLLGHKYCLRFLRKRGSHLFSDTLLIGSGYKGDNIKGFTSAMTHYGYNILGYLENKNVNEASEHNLNIFGNTNELEDVLANNSIDEIFIAMAQMSNDDIAETIKIADNYGVRVKLIPENPLLMSRNYKPMTMGDLAVFKLRQSPLDNFNKTIFKRLFDFFFALWILILGAPVFLIIALLILIDSRGPIFYTPSRKGEGGETFKCYKFRTMSVSNNPASGMQSTIVNDPRITRVGKWLRKLDLDELPQFLNVLKGEMSVIGPRPHRINLQDDFRKTVNDYMVRSYVKPGITGWAQVNGWRGPTVTDEQKNERVYHDLWYIENWSLWLDIKIIFLTVFGSHHKKAF